MERVAEQFDPLAVRAGEVGRIAVDHVDLDARVPHLGHQTLELLRGDADGDVVQAAEDLAVVTEVEKSKYAK